ncbi:ImmA/IrrE family metallo-endopeptidase [Clostridium sp. DSM 100503]|uniref:ImmA/IrrE family metallo-endopeptidase n=1 Tax=Clostridium sp. DSM 100503 TaxID=2963282 RepID=UPI002149E68E|nr:ImmA/IrrE family metallo-endopeptidase [Clostridium sp. DSM 100503]MCR1950440.1 ImmA/IrrE family metallo-endopeptidase [Clostridium sp. DSM 100503]
MAKTYKRKSQEEKEKGINELIEKANIGIENSFTTPESLKEFLNYMSKFYNYSLRNASLIQEQFRGALAVGSYAFWKEKGFTVNKGEKGIKILVPNRLSDYFINEKGEEVKLKDASKEEKKLIEQGDIEVRKGKLIFNQGYVFEVTQTNAKAEDLPKIFPGRWLDGEVKNYELMYKAMENIAKKIGVKIIEPKDELGAVKGVSYPATKEVALNPRNTKLQNVKTLIHELTHAKLHTMETRDNYTTNEKEFQAEMDAYVVCSYFGLDTSEYSFRYIKAWTEGVELKDKEKLVNEVRETVKEYIEVIEETLINNKEVSLLLESENSLEKRGEREYDKKLYEIKEQEVMNNEVGQVRENDAWKLTDKEIVEAERIVELNQIKEKIEYLMKENYGDFIRAMVSIENNIDDLEILDKVYENYMDNDYGLLNNAIDKAIEFEQENMTCIEIENTKDKTVEVKYSEVPGFIEGEKLTLVETMEKFKKEVENGAVNKAIEFTFSLNENIKYNEEFIIDKGTSVDLIEFIDEKIGDNFYLHELVEAYLKDNHLEFEHKEIVSEKDKKIEKYKENELE